MIEEELDGRIRLMKISIGILFIISVVTAGGYDFNGTFEYNIKYDAISLNSINSSNLSLSYRTYNPEKADATILGKHFQNFERSGIYFTNHSIATNYSCLISPIGPYITLKTENSSNLSAWFETTRIKRSYKQPYSPKNFGIELADNFSQIMWASNASIIQKINYNPIRKIPTENLSLNSIAWELDNSGKPIYINQSNKTKIIVHNGESIQAAINAAALGDIIEINSGTYNESLHINKCIAIRGIDIGGGHPIIDANGAGNVVEISADQVIVEGIIATNSSRSSTKPGAGIRLSTSNNCSIKEIVSYNNYYGLNLVDSNNNTISKCNISNALNGINIYFSNNNTVEQNIVRTTHKPLNIVSSEGNLIQGNLFRDNSQRVKVSKGNQIINSDEVFKENDNESKNYFVANTGPRPISSQSSNGKDIESLQSSGTSKVESESHSSSGKHKERTKQELDPSVSPISKREEYENVAQKASGTIVFNPPKAMVYGVGEWIDARIGLENTTRLVQGILGKGDVQFRNISVATNMTYIVKLEGDSSFNIVAKRPEAQILGTDPAVWLWLVTPLEAGNHTLILTVDLQLEKPPYNCRCVNVTSWPVSVNVLEPSLEQRARDIVLSSYSLTVGSVAFLASLFSLILLFRQLRKGKDGEN